MEHVLHRKRVFHDCVFSRCRGNISTELFPSNGCYTFACLHSCYVAMEFKPEGLGLKLYSDFVNSLYLRAEDFRECMNP
jgi:hypothetical protein